jgi:tetratricopeptide (TPR) repeat protein
MNDSKQPFRPIQRGFKKRNRVMLNLTRIMQWAMRHKLWTIATLALLVITTVSTTMILRRPQQPHVQQSNPAVIAYQKNLPALKKAVDEKPNDAGARKSYGVALYATGDLNNAKSQYEKAIDLNGKDALAYNYLGNTYRDLEKINKAVDAYQQAVKIDPKMANAYTNLANIQLYSQNKPQEAIETYKRALDELPEHQEIKLLLGIAYEQAKDSSSARKTYQSILSKDPTNVAAQTNLDRLNKQ